MTERKHYAEMLEGLKQCFPSPTSNPVMDGYFLYTVAHFLDRIDHLKGVAPLLGGGVVGPPEGVTEKFPEEMSSVEAVIEHLVDYCRGMILWAHPNFQGQVVPPPTLPSITAFMAAAIFNPNIIQEESAIRFAAAEQQVVRQLADLIGYDAQHAAGVFTFGGTGTLLYGCKVAIERLTKGQAMHEGIREELKIVASEVSHYTRLNVAGWLGLGTRNVVLIPATRDNEMSLTHLEQYLRGAFERGEKVAAIIATAGTTDAFGIDDVGAIVQLRDRLAEEYGVAPPHVHADAVIGWVWSVFRDYDFSDNPLGFHARTLRSLRDSLTRLAGLHLADSIGIDFHKTGYAPYVSSLFLLRDRSHLALLSRTPEQMPYLYQFGSYHPGDFTLECSRSSAGPLAALASVLLLGKEGYRVMIGHVVEMAEMLRERLESYPFIKVLNDYNYGPVTLIRLYPDGCLASETYQRELHDTGYTEQVIAHNHFNRRIATLLHERAMRGEGVMLSWTEGDGHGGEHNVVTIGAIKSFIMSPWTDLAAVEAVCRQLLEARSEVMAEMAKP